MRHAKRVLMCWEYGGGNGHVRRLKIIGDWLQRLGVKVIYGLRWPDVGSAVGIPENAIRSAPNWPLLPTPSDATSKMTSATYGDYLAQMMLGPYDNLATRFQAWSELVEAERPDLIIADYAPSLSLLYFGRIPIVAIGDGYTLPPISLKSFPRLIDHVPIVFKEGVVVRRVNKALRPHNNKLIFYYPQINRADQTHLLSLPCLDPYRDQRDGGWLGSPGTRDIVLRMQPTQRMFAYFHESRQTDSRLIEGLIRARLPGKAIFSTPLRRTVRQLEAVGIRTPDGLVYLPFELLNCGVLVHQGSAGMAMAGIAAGVPQVMIKTDLEKTLNANAIAARNAGVVLSWKRFEMPDLAIAIRNAADNPEMQKAARNLSLENTRYLRIDPAAEVGKNVLKLLGA